MSSPSTSRKAHSEVTPTGTAPLLLIAAGAVFRRGAVAVYATNELMPSVPVAGEADIFPETLLFGYTLSA